ncbi:carbohydrate esterase family 1 protein [Sistotremastrum suecicum HHB10207 ss-3]|uniref:S-formylglutathione hydrolase n=1 Tax=Sistotremastrum suecicum HHB10207 ss-3 TaxID=1314776 RepID=A0A166ASL8_9AGAM|nr:carbohydrate esterase family 1 protein [Sistotremastrum suecicum HHB10207 ss-3]
MALERVSSNKAFGGDLIKFKFKSESLGGLDANFNVYLPPEAKQTSVPVLIYLAGLTCTEDTGAQKGGFLRDASAEGIAIIFPDTSPRGAGIDGEDADWDFGTGAGFYLDATASKWSKYYNMYSHITAELPEVIKESGLPIDWSKKSIFGHSMGGHGALTIYLESLKTNSPFLSASAFAPISNPIKAPWGEKAFKGYLSGGLEEAKSKYDATEAITKAKGPLKILVDSGTSDNFYKQKQLLPENLIAAAKSAGHSEADVNIRIRDGYDHSYYFISTFAPEHIQYHAKILKA